jgi:carbon-monoxide dehydrogenase small subunit
MRGEVREEIGLAGRQPNLEIRRMFAVARSPDEVWNFFGQVDRVVGCLPGAALTGPVEGERIAGRMTVKLGPIRSEFSGSARITRDPRSRRGTIAGSGRDRLSGSRAAADIDYAVRAAADGASEVDIVVRALLSGALAQFGRSGIVDDLASRLTDAFAQNVERRLGRGDDPTAEVAPAPLAAGSLLWAVLTARAKSLFKRIVGTLHR